MINCEYLLVTGAPGSRWSGVVRDFYYSPDINTSDYKKNNSYTRKGQESPMHFGEYFGVNQQYSTNRLEWDKPFKENSYMLFLHKRKISFYWGYTIFFRMWKNFRRDA